jgi:hypothetical protein
MGAGEHRHVPSATIRSQSGHLMPTFPPWWYWELSFTGHAELRMEQRGVTEVEVRAMLERATAVNPSVVVGRFMIRTRHAQLPWNVIRRTGSRGQHAGRRDGIRGVRMTERSLQVTYRKGQAFAAYLHLSHPTGEKTARTVPSPDGLLVVDYGPSGHAVGVEITAPRAVPLERLNQLLARLGEAVLDEQDYEPVRAA